MASSLNASVTPDGWCFVDEPAKSSGRHPPFNAAETTKMLPAGSTRNNTFSERHRRLNVVLIGALTVARLLAIGHLIYSNSSVTQTGDVASIAQATLSGKFQPLEMSSVISPIDSAILSNIQLRTSHP